MKSLLAAFIWLSKLQRERYQTISLHCRVALLFGRSPADAETSPLGVALHSFSCFLLSDMESEEGTVHRRSLVCLQAKAFKLPKKSSLL